MADQTITPVSLSRFAAGTAAPQTALVALGAGPVFDYNLVPNDGRIVLIVHNGGVGTKTATISGFAGIRNFNQAKPITISVGEDETRVYGPFPTDIYNSDGGLVISAADTSLKVAAVRLPKRQH